MIVILFATYKKFFNQKVKLISCELSKIGESTHWATRFPYKSK